GQILPLAKDGSVVTYTEHNGTSAYDNEATQTHSYLVEIFLYPGERYTIGACPVILTDSVPDAVTAQKLPVGSKNKLPQTLADIGLKVGSPADADTILEHVNALRKIFQSNGFPFAQVKDSRYFLNHTTKTIEADVYIESGPRATMGELEPAAEISVKKYYLRALQTWQQGQLWNENRIDSYREQLRQTGLFATVEVYAADTVNSKGERNVIVKLTPAPERTVGGAVRYDSDLGAGILAYWEHRNITNRGDKLRFELPVWQSLQEYAASYRQPFFLKDNQDLIINGGLLHEDNDSYKLLTSSGAIGLERRLAKHWTGSARIRGEGGRIEEADDKERSYVMGGLPLSLTFNDTNRPLDATKGMRITLSSGPYIGYYNDPFEAIRARIDAHFFWRVLDTDSLVFALRGSYGTLMLANAAEVPPSIRFYSGGGGSVRGYDYRSIGPRNASKDPLGGESLVEFSFETRFKFNDEWGAVLFVDGGTVYDRKQPDFNEELQWGAGVGLRYYTVLGPVRFDIATPLNPRKDDSSVQLYLSIGQSF
ncbi:autotransporter assembly complex protein TamA, partial [Desulfovibrio sp. OttesenSCG-928-F07]|nr:autotransporter assembly complex protein TamA [Desulfovibrio sp. OttesenSCG-928-F07]